MNTKERASKAAKAKNKKYTALRRTQYRLEPNRCKYCNKRILPKSGQNLCEVTKKKFCNRKCAGLSRVKPKTKKEKKLRDLEIFNKTKGECKQYSNYHSRIRDNARRVYQRSGKPYKCFICGYETHVEICHVHPLKLFSDESLISEINSPSNLIALCPTHHWELDNDILTFKDFPEEFRDKITKTVVELRNNLADIVNNSAVWQERLS